MKKRPQRSTPFRELGSVMLRGQHLELLGADGIIRGESFRIKGTLVINARDPLLPSAGNLKPRPSRLERMLKNFDSNKIEVEMRK